MDRRMWRVPPRGPARTAGEGWERRSMKIATNTLENHWMPFTANRDFKAEPRLMVKAEGM